MTNAVWSLVPMFGEEMTEGQVLLSAVDMSFDPNPVISKNPEVYRLNEITKLIKAVIHPKTEASQQTFQTNQPKIMAQTNRSSDTETETKTAAFFDKLFPKKIRTLLASLKPLQPPDNLLAQEN